MGRQIGRGSRHEEIRDNWGGKEEGEVKGMGDTEEVVGVG